MPDSWERYFTVPLVMLDRAVVDGKEQEPKVNNRSPFDIKFDGICSTCNNGWMREVDEAARADVIPYATGETPFLDANALDRIALHLTRTALMTIWGKRNQNGYPPDLFREFYRDRAVPSGVRVFIGNVRDPVLLGGRHAALTLDDGPLVHFASWSMGRLFAVVLLPMRGYEGLTNTIARTIIEKSHRKVQLIAPLPDRPNLDFRNRTLTFDQARLLSRPKGLLTGEHEADNSPLPDHFTARLQRLNGDYTSLIKQASARTKS